MSRFREQIAGAARSLWMNYGTATQQDLKRRSGAQIAHAEAMEKMGRGYIHPTAFSIMLNQRRAQASFAERLCLVEGVSAEALEVMRTGQMAALCKKLDAREPDRMYTLEDMRTAYRLGFLAATDCTEEAEAYFSAREYSDDREPALGRL